MVRIRCFSLLDGVIGHRADILVSNLVLPRHIRHVDRNLGRIGRAAATCRHSHYPVRLARSHRDTESIASVTVALRINRLRVGKILVQRGEKSYFQTLHVRVNAGDENSGRHLLIVLVHIDFRCKSHFRDTSQGIETGLNIGLFLRFLAREDGRSHDHHI